MDLFIIIAAVLAVGGIVAAAIYGLGNSATQNASIAIVSATVHPYSGGAGAIATISVKNNGGSSLPSTVLALSNVVIGNVAGTAPTFSPSSVALAPGAQQVITVTGVAGTTGSLTAGNTISVTITLGSATSTITVVVASA